jgi:quercetin 2,3-dioxygenase
MLIESRPIKLTTRTGVSVDRTLPHKNLRTIGAWCFVDHFGPTKQTDGMVVASHPHTGLQTATWLFDGEIEHRDSLGTLQMIHPGQLNLMTAGVGISHSELSIASTENLHAVQLWIALPKQSLDIAPVFEHLDQLPTLEAAGFKAKVLIGEFQGVSSPATAFTPIVGVELRLESGTHTIQLKSNFEHGLLLVAGNAEIEGQEIEVSSLFYSQSGQGSIEVTTKTGATLLLIGGEPFAEKIVMWWNFIGRTHQDIAFAREQWNQRDARFGEFEDRIGGWIPAPDLPNVTLQPR